jgi:hypothetical protein
VFQGVAPLDRGAEVVVLYRMNVTLTPRLEFMGARSSGELPIAEGAGVLPTANV